MSKAVIFGILGGMLAIGLTIIFISIGYYNGVVKRDEACASQWSEIDNMLKRRADLIPNLVATVKGFAKQEKEIFTSVANARSKMMGAKGVVDKAKASGELSSALSRLLMVVERYPDLKSNSNFIRLQDELAGTENRIAVARTRYNEAVKQHNGLIRTFPRSFFANMAGVSKREYFEIENPKDKEVPKVDFNK